MSIIEDSIKEQAQAIMDIEKKAYDAGYKAGFEAGQKQLRQELKEPKKFEVMSPKDVDSNY